MRKIFKCNTYYYQFDIIESNNNFKLFYKNNVIFINKKEFIDIFKSTKTNKDIKIIHLVRAIKIANEFKNYREVFRKLVNFFGINNYSQQCLINESLRFMPIN